MKKLDKIFGISGLLMIIFSVGMLLYRLIESIVYQVNGWTIPAPGPSLSKWYDIFYEKVFFETIYVFPILLIGIIAFIISKIIKHKNNKVNIKE